jgi:hypothetical protein
MASRSKYLTIEPSIVLTDENGLYYPDIFTFPIDQFRAENVILQHTLTYDEVYRFDQFILNWYGKVNYYEEMIQWLNNIFLMGEDHIGSTINMYSKIDLDKFLTKYIRTN